MKCPTIASTLILLGATFATSRAADYTPGVQHNYAYESGNLSEDCNQYSVWVPKSYDHDRPYPMVIYLHGGGKGRKHPNFGKRNMVSARLIDNKSWTDAGYSGNASYSGYVHVAPVKPSSHWDAEKLGDLLQHVRSKVNIDENRVYVTGFSMGGQGTWIAANSGVKIAAMMPLGAWGCDEVRRGKTRETCKTTNTAVWVQHCPLDHVSKISEQISLYENHLRCGGYGRFTMLPGEGHISRERGESDEALSQRVAWMLSQTYGTPRNYMIQTRGGVIYEVVSGERGYLGDTSRYGFFEPGSVIRVTAPKTKKGKRFVKWAAARGSFDDATFRRASYTVAKGDAELLAIYEGPAKLTVIGGKAKPESPKPGDLVTVTMHASDPMRRDFYWAANRTIELPHPYRRSVTFCMPNGDLTIAATTIPGKRLGR